MLHAHQTGNIKLVKVVEKQISLSASYSTQSGFSLAATITSG